MSVEILTIKRTGTGYEVGCIERVVEAGGHEVPTGGVFALHVVQANAGGLSPGEQVTVDAAWRILEEHAAETFGAKRAAPEDLRKLVADATEAEKRLAAAETERTRIETETIAMAARHATLVAIVASHERQAADADLKNDLAHVALAAKKLELESVTDEVAKRRADRS